MDSATLLTNFEQWSHVVLEWIGFGTLVGLLAKAIMPGRDPGGAVATLAMGVGGTIIGLGTLTYFYHGQRISPISPLGLLVATGGAFALLFFYRLLGGRLIREGTQVAEPRIVVRGRPRRTRSVEYVDTDVVG